MKLAIAIGIILSMTFFSYIIYCIMEEDEDENQTELYSKGITGAFIQDIPASVR